ncbi:hypothetical protein J809_3218 [Acinetobacter sp. 25977_6]|nr:hypothetical protein J525_0502 [Acinetobacter sp. 21871]EXR66164.1 hypothetical protein J678_0346 [Acinetobacter sp. 1424608]EXT42265.1 hypothetical protein J809_3218 [Acinetobacter sp. 25977_6]EXT43410.1 hypothetical protein J810_2361 [Acinetobacter sp. 25977_7]EXT50151.1 hypothetical protein J807_2399 [Acinetobacter sp. 25977_4]EXT54331.1 hypothetical protein J806_2676 [Acinetobacter sp. 25977_3]EXT58352.1 hypothetical protein J805_2376 [Acinetobacter sp. 25977_2]EXT60422.1 hypothetical
MKIIKNRVLTLKNYAYFCKKLVKTGVYMAVIEGLTEKFISNKIFK